MAIRYNKDYNREIQRSVKRFNNVRRTLSKKGIKLTSAPLKVSELKARYQTRRELNKELTLLNKVSSRSDKLLKSVENQGGATAVKWELDYLKLNEKNAIDYYQREYELVSAKVGRFPGERTRLNNLEQKLNTLNLNLDYMNQDQFNSYRSAIRNYMAIPAKIKGGYRGFLIEVEEVMRRLGYDNDKIDEVFEKLKVLKPHQFHAMYEESDLIGRIYGLIQSPKHKGSGRLTTDVEDAEGIMEDFLEQEDDLVEKYRKI